MIFLDRDRRKASEQPLTRFVREITDETAVSALSSGLRRQPQTWYEKARRERTIFFLNQGIDWKNAERHVPNIDLPGFMEMIAEVSSMFVWEHVLDHSHPTTRRKLKWKLKTISNKETASRIEGNNSGFILSALKNALLGTAVGKNASEVVKDSTEYGSLDIETIAYSVALALGERFQTPVKSAKELLERLEELIPDPDASDSQDGTLHKLFVKHNTFEGDFSGEVRHCPAVHLTKVLLGEWGKHLATDEAYRQRFLSTVSK